VGAGAAGTVAPPELPCAERRVLEPRRHVTALELPCAMRQVPLHHPLFHDFDNNDHLDLGYLGIKGLSSACGTRWFLLQSQHTRHHDAATARGCQFIKFYL
jgi:hypothetical protein